MTIAAIALFAALAGSPALQADTAPRVETRSEIRIVTSGDHDGPGRLDADGDGVITREEFSAPMGNAFDRLDADHDGRLSTEEMTAGYGEGGPGEHVMMMRHPGGPDGPGGPGNRVIVMRDGPGGPGGPGGLDAHFRMFGGEGGPGVVMLNGGRGEGGDVRVFTFGGPGGDHGGPGERHVEVRRFGGPGGDHSMDANNDGKVSEEEFLAPMREAFQHMDTDHNGTLDEGEGHDGPPPPPPSAH